MVESGSVRISSSSHSTHPDAKLCWFLPLLLHHSGKVLPTCDLLHGSGTYWLFQTCNYAVTGLEKTLSITGFSLPLRKLNVCCVPACLPLKNTLSLDCWKQYAKGLEHVWHLQKHPLMFLVIFYSCFSVFTTVPNTLQSDFSFLLLYTETFESLVCFAKMHHSVFRGTGSCPLRITAEAKCRINTRRAAILTVSRGWLLIV